MMKHKKPNPLDFFEIRKTSIPCGHFTFINIPLKYNLEQSVANWIKDNLKGRYYVGRTVALDESGQMCNVLKIGFEEHKECTYFTLACPLLKYN